MRELEIWIDYKLKMWMKAGKKEPAREQRAGGPVQTDEATPPARAQRAGGETQYGKSKKPSK